MKIDGNTKIYGIIGYPVRHTHSPAMHNAAFSALGINAAYLPFEVKPEELMSAVNCIKSLGICGFNITIPHKENVIPYLDEIDREARLIGAVNTVVNRNGRLKGYNTDGRGFINSLKEEFDLTPNGKRFFILGAGGASRAISFSLAFSGARRIVLVDVVSEKAIDLARQLSGETSCEGIALKRDDRAMKEIILNSDVLINATPCGMKPSDPKVINPGFPHKGLLVCDLIYNPSMTRFLIDAKKEGARISNGRPMLLHQGMIAFELWTGRRPPLQVMKKALGKS